MIKDTKIFLMNNDSGHLVLDLMSENSVEFEYSTPNASYGFTIVISQPDFNLLKILVPDTMFFKNKHELGYHILDSKVREGYWNGAGQWGNP